MYRNEVTRTVNSALTKIQGANSKQAREKFHRMGVALPQYSKFGIKLFISRLKLGAGHDHNDHNRPRLRMDRNSFDGRRWTYFVQF